MSKGRLSSEEVQSLFSNCDAASPLEAVTTSAPPGTAADPSVDGEKLDLQSERVPSCTAPSADTASDMAKVPEEIARGLRAALSEALRAEVRVDPVRAERVLYRDFAAMCSCPTCFATMGEEHGSIRIAADIGPAILLAAINRLLGGSLQDAPLPLRPLTQIETALARRLIDLISRWWQSVLGGEGAAAWDASPVTERPQRCESLSETQMVVCVEFEVQMGSASGLIRFAVPPRLIERAATRCSSRPPWMVRTTGAEESVDLSAVLAKWRVSLDELSRLKAGDVILTGTRVDAPIEIELDGKLCFRASPGALDGNKAVRIEQVSEAN